MKISEEHFDQICPSYKTAIKNFEQKLEECLKNDLKEVETMLEFAENYLMPIKYWKEIFICDTRKNAGAFTFHHSQMCYHFYLDEDNDKYISDGKDFMKAFFHEIFFDDTYIVATCSNRDDCISEEYQRFFDVHPFAKIKTDPTADGTAGSFKTILFLPSLFTIAIAGLIFSVVVS
uniref:Uncharacterized protein n=1 Tax=Panagrolaimus davidi TaxID=227884 RepID=A0A914PXX8_9BILA